MLEVRDHNSGSLFQRKSGRDRGVWTASVTMRNGKRASRTAHSRDDAKAQLAELLRLRDAGARDTGRVRLGDYLERWVSREHGWAPATRRKHEAAIRVHLVPRLGHIRLSELRTADVSEALADYLASGLGAQSVRHLRATLRRGLADAVRDGLVSVNVGGLAQPPRLPHRERSVLSADDARRLIDSTRGTRYGPLWAILVTTGLRISEALGLAWSDVAWGSPGNGEVGSSLREQTKLDSRKPTDAASVTIRHQLARENGEWVRRQPKTAKGRRQIPLTPLGVEALRAQRAMQAADRGAESLDGLVFTTSVGHPIHATNLLPKLRADLAAAGLPKVGLHDLRHSTATILLREGMPLPSISAILGHSTIRVTMDIYAHVLEESKRETMDAMQRALG